MTHFPFDAVLFDCDGVLVDSEPITNRVLAQILGEMGWSISHEECMRIFTGKAVRDEAALIAARTGVQIDDAWTAQFRQRRNDALDRELTEIPGAPKAVRELHAMLNGRIAVASGADLHKVRLQLTKVGLVDCFGSRVFSGQDMPRSKPFPDVYLAAAQALGVPAVRCAVVEDTVTGATAGVAAGATVFGYSPGNAGHSDADALRATGVHFVFTDMAELPALMAAHASGAAMAPAASAR
ncbi:HAD-IA family hydrolase [Pusillimonas sp. TS35]|nr:HAD-IA family hydrolase [Pusillimonas sp. TS35]